MSNDTQTLTLTDFLLARIAEDEEVARAASPAPWQFGDVDSVAGGTLYDATRRIADVTYEQRGDHDGTVVRHLLSDEADANGAHIARHDPGRVLAECEAKRRIIALHDGGKDRSRGRWINQTGCACGDLPPCRTLAYLALPYADHPDYRKEWRP